MVVQTRHGTTASTSTSTPNIDPETISGSPSHGGSGDEGNGTWDNVVGSSVPVYVFSARTCLEVLPTLSNAQIDTEIKHLIALDAGIHSRITDKTDIDVKRDLLHKSLTHTLIKEVDTIVNKYDILFQSLHRCTHNAMTQLDAAESYVAELQQTATSSSDEEAPKQILKAGSNLDPPVSFPGISFANINFDDVEKQFRFDMKLPGNRDATYFGSVEYEYGSIKHPATPYPDGNPVIAAVAEGLKQYDPAFSLDEYTCLVTRYQAGNSTISMHHDDESSIAPNSDIYTVSFGEARTMRFYNIRGPIQEQFHKLEHGMVHVMTSESQSLWKHGIGREPDAKGCRISLTFRKLITSTPPSNSQQDSPIPARATPAPPPQPSRPTRVLLLTDSILASTPVHLFENIPNHICIKRKEYQFANLDQYQSEFEYTDVVILSMGINDLSRYGHTARTLADCIAPRLKHYSHRYPDTKFVINSVLLTRDIKWCNKEVHIFNQIMFELSRDTRNLSFFDSDRFAEKKFNENKHIRSFFATDRSNNGIHISLDMRKIIVSELVNSVGYLSGIRAAKFGKAQWLYNVTTRSSWSRAG